MPRRFIAFIFFFLHGISVFAEGLTIHQVDLDLAEANPNCRYDTQEHFASVQISTHFHLYDDTGSAQLGEKPLEHRLRSFKCGAIGETIYYYRYANASTAQAALTYLLPFVWGELEIPSPEHPEAIILADNIIAVISGDNADTINALETQFTSELTRRKLSYISIGKQFAAGLQFFKEKNYPAAIKSFKVLAGIHHSGALNNLCTVYFKMKNGPHALDWCHKAADQGHKAAQYTLGWLYWSGLGVAKNTSRAVRWWKSSAEKGFAPAQYKLALLFENGDAVKQNLQTAFRYYTNAADNGYAEAQVHLAKAYLHGRQVNADIKQSYYWLKKASAAGNAEASSMLTYLDQYKAEEISAGVLNKLATVLQCDKSTKSANRFACASLKDFREGRPLQINPYAGQRLVGVGAAFNDPVRPQPYFELAGLEITHNDAVSDKIYSFHVTPTEPGEQELIASAVDALLKGKTPLGNAAYDFVANSPLPDNSAIAFRNFYKQSTACLIDGFRVLFRQTNNAILALEIHPSDDKVSSNRFYVMQYDLKLLEPGP